MLAWIKEFISKLDAQPRSLSQFLASANLQGFKRNDVLSVLESYAVLKEIYYNLQIGVIYSLKVVPREIQDETDKVFSEKAL